LLFSNKIIHLKTVDNICNRCSLRNLCSVKSFSASERKTFSDVTTHGEKRDRGQHLFYPGDIISYIYFVHSGSFKTYISDIKGEIQITGFYFQGDVIDLSFSNDSVQSNGAVAMETSTVCKIPLTEFEKMVSQFPTLFDAFLKLMSKEIIRKQRMLLVLGKMKAEEKVANFLVNLSRENEIRGYSPVVFNLRMLRSDIANYLGLADETVSRLFNELQSKGIISIEGRKVFIENLEKLKSLQKCVAVKSSIKSSDYINRLKTQR
jgi:CRP/FNR family transcriptional regulator, anaerobic regulatory protein